MSKKILGLDVSVWRELAVVTGLSLIVSFAGFFWDLSKNGSGLVTYAQNAVTQKNYVAVTMDATGLKAHGVATDGTYDIRASSTPQGDAAKTIVAMINGSGLEAFRFIGSAGGQVIGTEASAQAPAAGTASDAAKPLTFFGPAADPDHTLAITQQGTKTVGKDSFLRFEVIPGQPTTNVIVRGLATYAKGFGRSFDRAFIYVSSKAKLPVYVLQTGPSGIALTVFRYDSPATVNEAWNKFQGAGAQKLAFFGFDPTEAAQVFSER
ncbi:MAG: hypothetical protein ACYC6I_02645 [Bacillota bacterium]